MQSTTIKSLDLSSTQQPIYLSAISSLEASVAYNIAVFYKLSGEIDAERLGKCLQHLVAQHDILRTAFIQKNGMVRQEVLASVAVYYETILIGGEDYERKLKELGRIAFDVAVPPLCRFYLLRFASGQILGILVVMHHLITDGMSFNILMSQLVSLYEGRGLEINSQYSEFCDRDVRVRDEQRSSLRDYWVNKCNEREEMNLPCDYARPSIKSYAGSRVVRVIEPGLSNKIRDHAKSFRSTQAGVVLALWAAILARYSGSERVFIGSPVSLRDSKEKEVIGCFTNSVVLRLNIGTSDTFKDLVAQVKRELFEVLEHKHAPFDWVVKEVLKDREPSRNPVFDVMFIKQTLSNDSFGMGEAILQPREIDLGCAKIEMSLSWSQGRAEEQLALEFNSQIYSRERAERVLDHIFALLQLVSEQPDVPLVDIEILTEWEKLKLAEWNETAFDFGVARPLNLLIREQSTRTPMAEAVIFHRENLRESITYLQLDQRASVLAQRLAEQGVGKGDVVGILMERSIELVVSLYAVLKVGAAYLPFSTEDSDERIQFLIADASIKTLVFHTPTRKRASAMNCMMLSATAVQEGWNQSFDNSHDNEDCELPAYILYTSGSTGEPKAVVNTHKGIHNRLFWMQEAYQLREEDRVLQKTPYTFDVSVWEFFWPLINGAALVVARPEGHRDPTYINSIIDAESVTTIHFVPSMLRVFLESEESISISSTLRRVICSGEALTADLKDAFFAKLPRVRLYNLYGPTEAAIDVTAWECAPIANEEFPVIPIGKPISNTKIYILNGRGVRVPVGVLGEIYISGANVAQGYLNRPTLTAQRFLPDRFSREPEQKMYRTGDVGSWSADGVILYHGRTDFQVKVRGNRVEPQGIEKSLLSHSVVREAIVLPIQEASRPTYLVCFYRAAERVTENELRKYLSAKLPSYSIPSFFRQLTTIPLTSNGKVDRRALSRLIPALVETEEDHPKLSDPTERQIANIWKQVLRLQNVEKTQSFFSLGGDSILILQILSHYRKIGLTLALPEFLEHPTIVSQANLLREQVSKEAEGHAQRFSLLAEPDSAAISDEVDDAYPLTALQKTFILFNQSGQSYEIYVTKFHVRANFSAAYLDRAIAETFKAHEVLRSSVDLESYSEPIQIVHRNVILSPEVIDIRNLPPLEQAETLWEWIEEERRRPFDWSSPPLLRVTIHLIADSEFHLTLSEPWLDGWSVSLLGKELLERYRTLLNKEHYDLQLPKCKFSRFVELELNESKSTAAQAFWEEMLLGHEGSRLTIRTTEPDVAPKATRVSAVLDNETIEGARKLGRERAIPIRAVYFAAYVYVVAALSGSRDVVVGLMSNGRPEIEDGDRVIGLFLNSLPTRFQLEDVDTWNDLLDLVLSMEKQTAPYRRYPLSKILQDKRALNLFDCLFNFTDFRLYRDRKSCENFELIDYWGSDQTYFPLTLHCFTDVFEMVRLDFDSNSSQISENTLECIASYYIRTLRQIVESSAGRLNDFSMLSELELEDIEAAAGPASTKIHDNLRLDTLFDRICTSRAGDVAIYEGNRKILFDELKEASGRVVRFLLDNEVKSGSLIGIQMERSWRTVAVIIGILRTGCAYVPLDVKLPEESVTRVVDEVDIAYLFVDGPVLMEKKASGRIIVAPDDWEYLEPAESVMVPEGVRARAYVMYTSGSTGEPKGVEMAHSAVLNRLAWMWQTYPLCEGEIVAHKTSLSFVDSVWELFGPILTGHPIVVIPEETVKDITAFVDTLSSQRVTRVTLVPTLLAEILRLPSEYLRSKLCNIKQWVLSGESLPQNLVWRLRESVGNSMILNLYGSTEVSADVSCHECKSSDSASIVYIGCPIANTKMFLVDCFGKPVPRGWVGEIAVGGQNLAEGYFKDPVLTASKFVKLTFGKVKGHRFFLTGDLARHAADGEIEILGRRDRQLNLNGVRIDIAEIESALESYPGVKRACVILNKTSTGGSQLVAAVSIDKIGRGDLTDEIRSFAKRRLPRQYVPKTIVVMELPTTISGKVDRKKIVDCIEKQFQNSTEIQMLETSSISINQEIVAIWKDVFGRNVPVEENLFDTGGSSISAARIIARIRARLNLSLSLEEVFDNPSISELSRVVEGKTHSSF